MTDTNMEGGQAAGSVEQPNQPVSATESDQQLSPVDVKALKTVLKDWKEFQGQLRALQQDKDRGVRKLSQDFKELSEQFKRYEQLKARGFDQDEIERQMELDALLAERRGTPAPTDVPPGGGGGTPKQAASVDTAALVQLIGLDANSPEVLAVIRDHSDDTLAQLSALTDLGQKKRAVQQTPPNPAQIMSSGGGATAPDQIETLNSRLSELMKSPTQNLTEINKVQAELEKLVRSPH